jgi:hypothetical protein
MVFLMDTVEMIDELIQTFSERTLLSFWEFTDALLDIRNNVVADEEGSHVQLASSAM